MSFKTPSTIWRKKTSIYNTSWKTSPMPWEVWNICSQNIQRVTADLFHLLSTDDRLQFIDMFHIKQFLVGSMIRNFYMPGRNGPNMVRFSDSGHGCGIDISASACFVFSRSQFRDSPNVEAGPLFNWTPWKGQNNRLHSLLPASVTFPLRHADILTPKKNKSPTTPKNPNSSLCQIPMTAELVCNCYPASVFYVGFNYTFLCDNTRYDCKEYFLTFKFEKWYFQCLNAPCRQYTIPNDYVQLW